MHQQDFINQIKDAKAERGQIMLHHSLEMFRNCMGYAEIIIRYTDSIVESRGERDISNVDIENSIDILNVNLGYDVNMLMRWCRIYMFAVIGKYGSVDKAIEHYQDNDIPVNLKNFEKELNEPNQAN